MAGPQPCPHPIAGSSLLVLYGNRRVAVLSHFAFSLHSALFSILRRNSQIPWMFVTVELDFLDPEGSSRPGIVFSSPVPLKVIAKGVALRPARFWPGAILRRLSLPPHCAETSAVAAWCLGPASAEWPPEPSPLRFLTSSRVTVSSQPFSHSEVA